MVWFCFRLPPATSASPAACALGSPMAGYRAMDCLMARDLDQVNGIGARPMELKHWSSTWGRIPNHPGEVHVIDALYTVACLFCKFMHREGFEHVLNNERRESIHWTTSPQLSKSFNRQTHQTTNLIQNPKGKPSSISKNR